MTTSTADRLRETADALGELAHRLATATSAQYDRPLAPSTRQDTAERALGGVSRPTEDIALDPRRLRLRGAVYSAEAVLGDIATSARTATADLDDALGEWAGPRA